jgi:hypothetical protein
MNNPARIQCLLSGLLLLLGWEGEGFAQTTVGILNRSQPQQAILNNNYGTQSYLDYTAAVTNGVPTTVVMGHSFVNSNQITGVVSRPLYAFSLPNGPQLGAIISGGLAAASVSTNLSNMGNGYFATTGPTLIGAANGKTTVSVAANGVSYGVFNLNVNGVHALAPINNFTWQGFTNGTPETNCLQWNMRQQLISRTNGNVTSGSFYTTNNWHPWPPYYPPDYWLRDVTNIHSIYIVAPSTYQTSAHYIPISPRHCVTATHIGNFGQRIWFFPDGTAYTNYVIAATNYGDLSIMLMAYTNPAYVKVMGTNYASKVDSYYRFPTVCIRQHAGAAQFLGGGAETTFISRLSGLFSGGWVFGGGSIMDVDSPTMPFFGDYHGGDLWWGGDSASGAYVILNNEAILLGCASGANQSTSLGNNVDLINGMMEKLSTNNGAPVYHLSLYDLSAYPDL